MVAVPDVDVVSDAVVVVVVAVADVGSFGCRFGVVAVANCCFGCCCGRRTMLLLLRS